MPATFLDLDTTSRGAGSAGRGAHGYTHVGTGNTPVVSAPNAGLGIAWAAGATAASSFAAAADPPRYLLLPDGVTTRDRAITRSFNPAMRLALTVSDGASRIASVYMFAASPVRQTVEARLPGAGTLLASYTVPDDYQAGQWVRFSFDESIDLVFAMVGGGGPTACAGVFIDPAAGPTSPYAILDESGASILDESGAEILAEHDAAPPAAFPVYLHEWEF